MSLDPVKNFGKVTVSTGYNNAATSIVLSSGDGAKLPAPAIDGAFNLTWWNATDYSDPSDDPNKEIVRCTARSTDTLTVSRAQESTSAANHNTAGKSYLMALTMTKKTIDDLNTTLAGLAAKATSGSGAPVSTPVALGYIYIDTNTQNVYMATGTSSSADWKLIASY